MLKTTIISSLIIIISVFCIHNFSNKYRYLNTIYSSKLFHSIKVDKHIYVDLAEELYEKVEDYDVSIVSQTSKERLFYFKYLVKRWRGPFVIGFQFDDSLSDTIDKITSPSYFTSQVHLIPYYSSNSTVYPINLLRNMAIKAVTTTHFWMTDMDMWPASNLYETLLQLPVEIQQHKYFAMIVPAFEYTSKPECNTLEECVKIFASLFPQTKKDLIKCVQTGNCMQFRMKAKTHFYFFPQWYSQVDNIPYTLVDCFPNKIQEPYIVLKKTKELPLFDPRFINYGFNKIQWIEELRYKGYLFGVLSNGFAIDVPHPRSKFALDYISQWKDVSKVEMKNLYESFMNDLVNNNPDLSVVYLCPDSLKSHEKGTSEKDLTQPDSTTVINTNKFVYPQYRTASNNNNNNNHNTTNNNNTNNNNKLPLNIVNIQLDPYSEKRKEKLARLQTTATSTASTVSTTSTTTTTTTTTSTASSSTTTTTTNNNNNNPPTTITVTTPITKNIQTNRNDNTPSYNTNTNQQKEAINYTRVKKLRKLRKAKHIIRNT